MESSRSWSWGEREGEGRKRLGNGMGLRRWCLRSRDETMVDIFEKCFEGLTVDEDEEVFIKHSISQQML